MGGDANCELHHRPLVFMFVCSQKTLRFAFDLGVLLWFKMLSCLHSEVEKGKVVCENGISHAVTLLSNTKL